MAGNWGQPPGGGGYPPPGGGYPPPGGGYPPPGGGYPPPGGAGWGQQPPPPPGGGGWGQPPNAPGGWGAPPPGMPPGYQPGGGVPLEGGVPWESPHGGFFGRWWDTLSGANFKGKPFWMAVAQSGEPLPACTHNVVSGTIAGAGLGFWYMLMLLVWGAAVAAMFGGRLGVGVAGAGIGYGVVMWISITGMFAVSGFIGPWIFGGLQHLVLMMLSGVGQGKEYSHTVRAHAYAQSAANVFMAIPIVGGLVSLVFSIKNHIEGLDAMHNCGGGKAFLAWVSPVFCCCCAYLLFYVLVLGAFGLSR